MKKLNFFRSVFIIAAAMLISTAAFGQQIPTVYEEYDVAAATYDSIDYITAKPLTAGLTRMGYWAVPDPVYHPNYTSTATPTPWTLTSGFVWNWSVAPAGPTFNPATPANSNYVEITFPATPAAYTILVTEQAPTTMGGCVDATPTKLRVHTILPPTGTISIAPSGWEEDTENELYYICAPATPTNETVTVSFVENIPFALAAYSFQITETIELLDGAGNPITATSAQAETVIENFDLTNKLKSGDVTGDDATSLTDAAFVQVTPSNFAFTFTSASLAVRQTNAGQNARTKYTYKVTRSGDTDEDNFLSAISQKSDFLLGTDNETYFAFTNNTVSFVVNPAPATGPIYHIPNNFAY